MTKTEPTALKFISKKYDFRMSLGKELTELVLEKLDASANNLNEKASGQVQRKFQSSGKLNF